MDFSPWIRLVPNVLSMLSVCGLLRVGGFDDNAPLDCVERYDPGVNTWSMVVSMSCPRGGVGVAALGGKLYAVGGHDGTNYLSSVEEYDPSTDRCVVSLCGL